MLQIQITQLTNSDERNTCGSCSLDESWSTVTRRWEAKLCWIIEYRPHTSLVIKQTSCNIYCGCKPKWKVHEDKELKIQAYYDSTVVAINHIAGLPMHTQFNSVISGVRDTVMHFFVAATQTSHQLYSNTAMHPCSVLCLQLHTVHTSSLGRLCSFNSLAL